MSIKSNAGASFINIISLLKYVEFEGMEYRRDINPQTESMIRLKDKTIELLDEIKKRVDEIENLIPQKSIIIRKVSEEDYISGTSILLMMLAMTDDQKEILHEIVKDIKQGNIIKAQE